MHLKNVEAAEAYFISEDWHSIRKPGIAAMLRVKDEEEFIKPCLVSIKDFFDEIVIALNCCTDNTPKIIAELNLPQVRVLEYPFTLHHNGPGHNHIPENSLHDNAYFYNWVMSKTHFQHVCKWDGDMIALPGLNSRLRKKIQENNIVHISEVTIAGEELAYLSREAPPTSEPRFFRVDEDTFYKQGEICEYFTHTYREKVCRIDEPLFLHFKHAKSVASATKIWPDNWEELEIFQKLHERRVKGAVYRGVYPTALQEKIFNRALDYSKQGSQTKPEEEKRMGCVSDVLFKLRNSSMRGDILWVGPLEISMELFLKKLLETLFPDNKLRAIDSCCDEAVNRLPSRSLLFSFLGGEGASQEVMHGFKILLEKTMDEGVIAYEHVRNVSPEEKSIYECMISNYGVEVFHKNSRTTYLMKKSSLIHRIKRCFSSART